MKTITTHHESYQPKQGFGARLLFYAFLLSLIGLSKAFAQAPNAPVATAATSTSCSSFNANWGSVSGATTYYLDVATDSSFTSFLAGYNNLNTGNVSTYVVGGLTFNTVYYYRLRAENGNGTSVNSNVITFIVGGPPTVTATPQSQTICSNDSTSIFLSGSDPNTTFTWTVTQSGLSGTNAGSGSVISDVLNLTGTSSGVAIYMVTPISNGCHGSSLSVSVTVNNCNGQSFIYSSATYCQSAQNPTPTINNPGGTFSATPAGLVINSNTGEIDLALSAVGVYTIVYTYGSATDAITFTVTSGSPDATFSYGIDVFDPNGANPFPIFASGASAGYFYSFDGGVVINSNTGEIDLAASTPGEHYILNQIQAGGTCTYSADDDTIYIAPLAGCSAFTYFNGDSAFYSNMCSIDSISAYLNVAYFNLTPGTTTLSINWGDGTVDTYPFSNGTGTGNYYLSGNLHLYTSPGVYTVTTTVTDPSACYNHTSTQSVSVGSTLCGTLSGKVFTDVNSNCSLNNGTDIGMSYQLITATDANNNVYYAWTDYMGNYAFNTLPNGVYTVNLGYLNLGYTVTCSGILPATITVNNNSQILNVPLTCSGQFDAAITGISLWSGFFPGQPDGLLPHVGILNAGCNATSVSGQVKIVLDACIQYTGPSTWSNNGAPDVVIPASTGDTLVWNVADINNIGNFSYWDYAVNTLTCTTAQVGDSACITMMILPTNGDADPSNNTYTRCFEIGVSYDPNNKEVMPTGDGAQGFIPADQPSLTYTLNFQNTGTAKAWNIYVMDTIDTDLDINSIEILSASHRMQVYTLPNRAVKFMFPDIMLIDSTHDEPNSHGYVTFKIKVNQGLTPGTAIENTGHIYFDYNEPIVTNTTLNTIEFPSSVNAIAKSTVVKVFPNPAKESITVLTTSNNAGKITVTDLLGKTIKEVTTTNEKTIVNTADLQSGVYFIKLTQNNVTTTEKIMIAK